MCLADVEKSERETIKVINYQIMKEIWTLEEKENCKYSGIVEADINKKVEMKEENTKKITPEEQEIFEKPNSVAEVSSKE